MSLTSIILFIGGLGLSFLLSGMEAGVFALSRLRIRHLMRAGNARARALHDYLEKPEDFLWTILVGNTLSNIMVVSIGVWWLFRLLWMWPWALFLALVAGILLFYAVCELLPKMLFRVYPNRLCLALVRPFGLTRAVLRPVVVAVAWLARGLLHWTGGKRFTGGLFGNRDELRALMHESSQALTTEERTMINRVLDLQNLTVRQITVPMTQVSSVSVTTPVSEVLARARETGFSRMPVWREEGARQRVAGLLNLRSLLYDGQLDPHKTAGDYLKPALYLDGEQRAELALRQMQRTGQRLAIVLGRDRQEIGIVSLQDVLKVIFGEVRL